MTTDTTKADTGTSAGASPGSPGEGGLIAGTAVGRLVVLQQIGEGGMGRVYAAYDSVLDRRVCLKFLKQLGEPDSAANNARLIAEARALAQVSHSNILPVYDVGQFEDQVYLVSEFVDGWTFSDWVASLEPSAEQILDAFRNAGTGLATAHAGGVVHRDFKPDNLMIGKDGRVRVMDFGLAASVQATERLSDGYGTPRFMAPEQLAGAPATASSDQYAFCLSLAACLGAELSALRAGQDQLAQLALSESQRTALRRGLSHSPEQRFADMPALLLALAPRRPDRTWMVAAGLAVVIAGIGSSYWLNRPAPRCVAAAPPSALWLDSQRAAMRQAFTASKLPYAESAFEHLLPVVDRYLSEWSDQRLSACQATHIYHQQSEELLDRRMLCLDSQLAQLDALGLVFTKADGAIVDGAMRAVLELPDPRACADRASLLNRAPLPSGPESKRLYSELDKDLAEAWAARRAGRYEQAMEQLRSIADAVTRFAHLPTQARYQQLLGDTIVELADKQPALQAFDQGLFLALTGGDLGMAVDNATGAAFTHTSIDSDPAVAESWYQRAELLAEQIDDPGRAAKLANEYGQFLLLRTDHAELALSKLAAALKEYRRLYGEDAPQTAMVMNEYAWALHRNGDLDAAIDFGGRSLAVIESSYGTYHNAFLAGANNYAGLLTTAHRSEEALALLQRAYEAGVDSVGAEHKDVLFLLLAWATALFEQQRYDEASPRFESVMRDTASGLGSQHRLYGFAATGAGACQRELGQLDAAVDIFSTALEAGKDNYPPILRASMAYELAQTLERAGAPREQIRQHAETAIRDGSNGPAEWRAEVSAFAERWR